MREKFLDLPTQNSSKQHGGVALAARVEKKAGKKYVTSKRENADSSSSQKRVFKGSASSVGRRVT